MTAPRWPSDQSGGHSISQPSNLLDLRPKRNLEWETAGDRVILLVPRFRGRISNKLLAPLFARPNIRVKLDSFGSYVWNRCDGGTTVMDIGEGMAETFGEPLDPLYDRIGRFLRTLARDRFLTMEPE
jgi:hypothetical protein